MAGWTDKLSDEPEYAGPIPTSRRRSKLPAGGSAHCQFRLDLATLRTVEEICASHRIPSLLTSSDIYRAGTKLLIESILKSTEFADTKLAYEFKEDCAIYDAQEAQRRYEARWAHLEFLVESKKKAKGNLSRLAELNRNAYEAATSVTNDPDFTNQLRDEFPDAGI